MWRQVVGDPRFRCALQIIFWLIIAAGVRGLALWYTGAHMEPDETQYYGQAETVRDTLRNGEHKIAHIYVLHHMRVAAFFIFGGWGPKVAKCGMAALGLAALLLVLVIVAARKRWNAVTPYAIVFCLCPFLVHYSTRLYPYMDVMLYLAVACFAYIFSADLVVVEDESQPRELMIPAVFLCGLSLGLCLLTHPTSVLLFFLFILCEIVVWVRARYRGSMFLFRLLYFVMGFFVPLFFFATLMESAGYVYYRTIIGGDAQLSGLGVLLNSLNGARLANLAHYTHARPKLRILLVLWRHGNLLSIPFCVIGLVQAVRGLRLKDHLFAENALLCCWLLPLWVEWDLRASYLFDARHTVILILPYLLFAGRGMQASVAFVVGKMASSPDKKWQWSCLLYVCIALFYGFVAFQACQLWNSWELLMPHQ